MATITKWMFLKTGLRQIIVRRFDWAAFFIIAIITLSVKVIFNY